VFAYSGQDATQNSADCRGLRILHVMRAPVGGLFRHVVDLAEAQSNAGHSVGVVADSLTGGAGAARVLEALSPRLALGVARFPMRRLPHPDDLRIAWRVARLVQSLSVDVVHGHGAKGGLYARLPALLPGFPRPPGPLARVYTPHGGTLHFESNTAAGRIFFAAERIMARVTDFMPFESDFARRRFIETIDPPPAISQVVYNGLGRGEFTQVVAAADAADLVFIGEMRVAKGVAELLHAFAALPGSPRLALVGSGRDEGAFHALAKRLGIWERAAFLERAPVQEALTRGRILVVPSRAESLPYIVLEALAAKTPVVATNVGGVPEIFGSESNRLAPPNDPAALARAMRAALEMDACAHAALADRMAAQIRARFTIELMNDGVLRGYRTALAAAGRRPGVGVAP
jgi:glycosyltransferase involved in cell wall biosynthesis